MLLSNGIKIEEESMQFSFNNNTSIDDVLGIGKNNANCKYHLCTKCTSSDLIEYDTKIKSSTTLSNSLVKNESKFPTLKYINRDIYLLLYLDDPVIRKQSDMFPTCRYNHKVILNIIKSESFSNVRENTIGNSDFAIIALLGLQKAICDNMEDWKENLEEYVKASGISIVDYNDLLVKEGIIEEKYTALYNNVNKIDALGKAIENEQDPNTILQLTSELDSFKEEFNVENAGQQIDVKALYEKDAGILKFGTLEPENYGFNISPTYCTTFNEADNFFTDIVPMIDNYGLDLGSSVIIPYETKIATIMKMKESEKLKAICDEIGRVEDAIKGKKEKSDNGTNVYNIKTGDSIQDITTNETMLLCNETTKADVYKRYSSKSLMIYNKNSQRPKKRGPVILCCDESGSMDGSKERYSKAIAIIFMKIAVSQKRDFCYIPFSGSSGHPIYIDYKNIDPDKVYKIATNFKNGGTNYQEPLKKAVEILEKDRFKKADIVFITDGESKVKESFLKSFEYTKKKKGFKVESILLNIGCRVSDVALKKFSDDIYKLSDLTSKSTADIKQVFNI